MSSLLKRLLHRASCRPALPTLESFFDADLNAFAIAPIPLNLKREVAARITVRTPGKTFNDQYLDSILPTGVGRNMFELALLQFLRCAAPFIAQKGLGKKNQLYPWKIALCFVPDETANAEVCLSADQRANTVFILMNAGVLLEPLHRLCTTFTVPKFFESISYAMAKTGSPPLQDPIGYCKTYTKDGNWLSVIPGGNAASMAVSVCIKGAMTILCHEVAHFLRGHLAYLQSELGFMGTLREVPLEGEDDQLEPSLRRLLELDADQVGARLAAVIWREYDHPAVGPTDAQNESFYLETILGIVSLNLIFEESARTQKYYSPIWRTQHFLTEFNNHFFAVPPGVNPYGADSPSNGVEQFKMFTAVCSALERAYRILGWGDGLSFDRFHAETATLEADSQALALLQKTLAAYMPHQRHF
jgi:hypothetical protein